MASIPNTENYGVAEGNISHIKEFNNTDGSTKIMITISAKNAYSTNGVTGSQFVRTEAFIAKGVKRGVYDYLEVGDKVIVYYTALNDDYDTGNGKWHYGMVLRITGVSMLESKDAKAYRKSKKAQSQTSAPASESGAQSLASAIESEDAQPEQTGSAFMDGVSNNNGPVFE